MPDEPKIDVPKLRRRIIEWLEQHPKRSRRNLSLASSGGRNADVVRDIFRVDKRMPTFETVAGLAAAMGDDVSIFIAGVRPASADDSWLTVSGKVEAGVFKQSPELPYDDWFQIEVEPDVEAKGQSGLIVEGRSMDRILPPGTILRCVPLIGSGIEFQDGDYVIVERKRDDLRETTCKKLARRPDGSWELRAESTLPEFQTPIFIGRPFETVDGPGFDAILDNEIRVKALVVDAYLPLRRRRTRPFSEAVEHSG